MMRQPLYRAAAEVTDSSSAHNAGEGAVEQYGGIPPYPETRAFVESVRGLY